VTKSGRGVRGLLGRLRSVAVAFALVAVLAGCGNTSIDGQPLGPVPDADMSLTANNQSDRALELYVNGGKIADVGSTTSTTFKAQDLPPLPWQAELRLTTGRTLLTLTVISGSVVRTANGSQGIGSRVDLSCGRIELWVIYPLLGPPPGNGHPGDCGP
jgi:hypothetical protein